MRKRHKTSIAFKRRSVLGRGLCCDVQQKSCHEYPANNLKCRMAFLPTKQLLHIHFMHLVGQLTYSTIVMLVWSFSCVYLLLLQTNKIYVSFFYKVGYYCNSTRKQFKLF